MYVCKLFIPSSVATRFLDVLSTAAAVVAGVDVSDRLGWTACL